MQTVQMQCQGKWTWGQARVLSRTSSCPCSAASSEPRDSIGALAYPCEGVPSGARRLMNTSEPCRDVEPSRQCHQALSDLPAGINGRV